MDGEVCPGILTMTGEKGGGNGFAVGVRESGADTEMARYPVSDVL